jgi:hypothetical protein
MVVSGATSRLSVDLEGSTGVLAQPTGVLSTRSIVILDPPGAFLRT